MKKFSHVVNVLNMSSGEVLTLEKATDRMEFEALPVFIGETSRLLNCDCKGTKCECNGYCSHCSRCSDAPSPLPCPTNNVG